MRESQKILANIIAAENITLVEKNTDTASFDMENRVVTIPNWVSLNHSDDVFNMMLGHETSHALYTPADAWDNIPKSIPRSYVNIVEDIRIEKMIKRTYMGLIPVFRKAYAEICKDFFKGFNENKSQFIDRLNVYFKCGENYNIGFSTDEQVIIDGLKTIETWDDVLYYANKLKDWHNDNEKDCVGDDETQTSTNPESQEKETSTEFEQSNESLEKQEESESVEAENEDGEDQDGEDQDSGNDESEDEDTSNDKGDSKKNEDKRDEDGIVDYNSNESVDEDDYKVATEESSQEYMKDQLESIGDIVIPFKESNVCMDSSKLYKEILDFNSSYIEAYTKAVLNNESNSKFLAECKKDANIMYSEFMRKKASKINMNATQSTSGVIDVNQLHSYKVNDNIFLSKAVLPEGQNHGVAIMLDVSGSMRDIMSSVLQQVITITMFCKKANIPFEVFIYAESVHQVFCTGQSKIEYETILAALLVGLRGEYYDRNEAVVHMPNSVKRYCTLTFSAVYNMYSVVHNMKVNKRLDIVNTMLFTDGASHKAMIAKIDEPDVAVSKYVLQGSAGTDHRVTLQMEFAKKTRTVDLTTVVGGHEINKKMLNVVFSEYKKLGNMIYVYCPTYNSSGLFSQVLHLSNELQSVCDHFELSKNTKNVSKEEYKKKNITDINYLFKDVSSCIVISKKVFKSRQSYDTITSNRNFDSTKDGQIVKAINAKTQEIKQRKTLVNIFASCIAEAII